MPVETLPPLPLVLLLPPSFPVSSFETLGLPPHAATVPTASSDAQPSAVQVLYTLQNLSKADGSAEARAAKTTLTVA
jgi:hypothetical protein